MCTVAAEGTIPLINESFHGSKLQFIPFVFKKQWYSVLKRLFFLYTQHYFISRPVWSRFLFLIGNKTFRAYFQRPVTQKYLIIMSYELCYTLLNPLAPNDVYISRTAQLTSRRYILNIYSTNILNKYFKHAAHSPFFSLQDVFYFIMLSIWFL